MRSPARCALPLLLLSALLRPAAGQAPEALSVFAGKSLLVESKLPIERVAVGLGDIAEATVVSPQEILLNGKTPGVTSLIVWQRGGGSLIYDVTVSAAGSGASGRIRAIENEIHRELPGQDVSIALANDAVFLRGQVKDKVSAARALAIASTLGKTVDLLYVDVPPADRQILLKVRFASIDRSASLQLGINLASTGAANTIGGVTTQQFSPPTLAKDPATGAVSASISDALNIFLLRPDLNLLATIRALQGKSALEILAEPNVLATDGKAASFLAGGEFPYPTFQAGTSAGSGSVTIQFREFGVRLDFLPKVTPRGTIQLQVAPEVSALDFTSGLVVQGFNVPALTVRRVSTDIELAPGQSFAIAGLIDNRLTETIDKIPLLGDLPVLGKFFQSKSRSKQNTELIVIVTPELVTPVPAGQPAQGIDFPQSPIWPKTTSGEAHGPAEPAITKDRVPIESLTPNGDAKPAPPPPSQSQSK